MLRQSVPLARVGRRTYTWSDCVPDHQVFRPNRAKIPVDVVEETSSQHWQELLETASACVNELVGAMGHWTYRGNLRGPHGLAWSINQFIELLHFLLERKRDALDCDEGRAFLSSITENRTDPTPCLILADWLDEHDDPARAEFIRLQCQRASRYPGFGRPPHPGEQEQVLAQVHGRRWGRSLPLQGAQDYWLGFPIRIRVMDWEAVPRLLESVPTLCWLELLHHGRSTSILDRLRPLLEQPALARLRSLALVGVYRFQPGHTDEVATLLAGCQHLANLEMLHLNNNRIGPGGASALASSPYLSRLTTLDLAGNQIGPAGIRALLESPWLSRLRWLDVSGDLWDDYYEYDRATEGIPNIEANGVTFLAQCPEVSRLRWLNITCNGMTPQSAEAIARSPHLSGLERLHAGEWPNEEGPLCATLKQRFGQRLSWGFPLAANQV